MITQAFAAGNAPTVGLNLNAWDAILSASLVVQLTLLLLVTLSILCWAIIFFKRKQFQATEEANGPFEELFWKSDSLDDIFEKLEEHNQSSMANVFKAGYLELRKLADSKLAEKQMSDESVPSLSGLDNLERSLRKVMDSEISKLESYLSFLATTGSTGPFIGLFGTVWGIMGAFQKIGATNMANLAVVAPGISEALIATAVGLVAAIPATVAYNYYITNIRKQELALNNFSADFLNIVKRNFFRNQ